MRFSRRQFVLALATATGTVTQPVAPTSQEQGLPILLNVDLEPIATQTPSLPLGIPTVRVKGGTMETAGLIAQWGWDQGVILAQLDRYDVVVRFCVPLSSNEFNKLSACLGNPVVVESRRMDAAKWQRVDLESANVDG
jgi:hypothetical protein